MPVAAPMEGIDPDATYYVQNEHKGPAAFNYGDAFRGQQFKWEGKGHTSGDDILAIPGHVVRDPQFQKMVARGLFTLVDPDSIVTNSGPAWQAETSPFGEQALAQMDRPNESQLVELHCICPMKGGKECGEVLFKRRAQLSAEPPLCGQHQKFAPRFQWNGTEWQRAE